MLEFSLSTLPKRIYEDKFHMCSISMEIVNPVIHNTKICHYYFKASRKYNSTCAYQGTLISKGADFGALSEHFLYNLLLFPSIL